ncbi:MAG TPA: PhnD/SsuA/transferrin family substrate-binding protein, partial [Rhizobacter sp.]|nr:PhnD/SsuA/transferrin family substrate-binding protein [Rhizobacter sp.]
MSFKHLLRCTALLLIALGLQARAQTVTPGVLRVTAIPDESPTELARKFEPLGKYLESKLGMKVEWTPVTDYAAAVETVVNRKIDL